MPHSLEFVGAAVSQYGKSFGYKVCLSHHNLSPLLLVWTRSGTPVE